MKYPIFCLAIVMTFVLSQTSDAHIAFKKELSKKYPDMKITCNACHVKKKPKTERNEFGKLFAKELKDKKITENFKSKEGAEKKNYAKDVMAPEFKKALEKIKKLKPKDGDKEGEKTYDELIKAGEMPEITKKPEENDEKR